MKSGKPIKPELHEHLFQHIKQQDPMLYEALKRIGQEVVSTSDRVENVIAAPQFQDKATFGLVKTLVVGPRLTLYYICRKSGKFTDFTAKIVEQIPTGSDAVLDVLLSSDDAATFTSIFPAGNGNKIVLPNSKSDLVIVKVFQIPEIKIKNLLRIDCLQVGSVNPGKGIEVVGRWT